MILCYIMAYILPKCAREFSFLPSSPLPAITHLFTAAILTNEKWYLTVVLTHISLMVGRVCLLTIPIFFLGKISVQIFCPLFNWVVFVFVFFSVVLYVLYVFKIVPCICRVYVFFICFRNWPLIRNVICKYFLPFSILLIYSFSFCWWFPLLCRAPNFRLSWISFYLDTEKLHSDTEMSCIRHCMMYSGKYWVGHKFIWLVLRYSIKFLVKWKMCFLLLLKTRWTF